MDQRCRDSRTKPICSSTDNAVQNQAQRRQLILHAVEIAAGDLAFVPVEDGAAQVMAAFLKVGLRLGLSPVGLVVGQAQDVQGFEDPPVVGDRLPQAGRVPRGTPSGSPRGRTPRRDALTPRPRTCPPSRGDLVHIDPPPRPGPRARSRRPSRCATAVDRAGSPAAAGTCTTADASVRTRCRNTIRNR